MTYLEIQPVHNPKEVPVATPADRELEQKRKDRVVAARHMQSHAGLHIRVPASLHSPFRGLSCHASAIASSTIPMRWTAPSDWRANCSGLFLGNKRPMAWKKILGTKVKGPLLKCH
ncbi:unnamed protein product [Cuscuta epithymum]|uniref:Uncharacterized protein n=1 Tax=Cuscuta epithymum TaxID=186058 RepID=A0AAV0FRN1_9ASTE|nr:unnamed protein product [Cuscuta epithymum]